MAADRKVADATGRETAQRFAQRARAERRRRRRPWFIAAAVVILLATVVALVGRSALLRVGSVEVAGNKRLPVADVLTAAAVPRDAPMWRLDTTAVRRRVALLPRVGTVSVARVWPRTVRITITERQPVAAVTLPTGGVVVVDNAAVEVERRSTPPAGLLRIALTRPDLPDEGAARRPMITAALAVAVALPTPIRARLSVVRVASTESVQLLLSDGKVITWGSAEDSERKAAVLAALLVNAYATYDVSAPENPAVR